MSPCNCTCDFHSEIIWRFNNIMLLIVLLYWMNLVMAVDSGYENNRYIVKYKQGIAPGGALLTRVRRSNNNVVVKSLHKVNAEVVILESKEEFEMVESDDLVEYIEKDHKVYMMASSSSNDTEIIPYGIKLVNALQVDPSYVSNRRVCIIDSGYDMGHPDLQIMNVTGSSGFMPWDEDDNGHGTHVIGTLAAKRNNIGVIGVVPNGMLNIHIVRVFDDAINWIWASDLTDAMYACVNAGSNIISMSLGSHQFSKIWEKVCNDIYENESVLLVAAAGNSDSEEYFYPASFDSVMSVAAIDSKFNRASFSQYNDKVNIAAPGYAIYSTVSRALGSYDYYSGTSMSVPHVAGVAALVWSHFQSLSAVEIRDVLERTATDLGAPGKDNEFGHGLINAKAAFDFLNGTISFSPTHSPTTSNPTMTPTKIHCNEGQKLFELSIVNDNYPSETSWELLNVCTKESVLEGDYEGIITCVDDQPYVLTIRDYWGDGILEPGGFTVFYDKQYVYHGGNFTYEDSVSFGDKDGTCLSLPPSLSPTISPSSFIPTRFPSYSPTLISMSSEIVRTYSIGFTDLSILEPGSRFIVLFQQITSDYLMAAINQTYEKKVQIETIIVEIVSQKAVDNVHDGIITYNGAYQPPEGRGILIEMKVNIKLKSSTGKDEVITMVNDIFKHSFTDYKRYLLRDKDMKNIMLAEASEHLIPLYVVVGLIGILIIASIIGLKKRNHKRKKKVAAATSRNEKGDSHINNEGNENKNCRNSMRCFLNLEDSEDEYLDPYITAECNIPTEVIVYTSI